MERKDKIRLGVWNTVISFLLLVGLTFFLRELEWYIRILLYILTVAIGIGMCVLLAFNQEKLSKSLFVANVVFGVVLAGFFVLNSTGLFKNLSDMEKIKNMILESGNAGILICFLLVLFNVVVLPIPATVLYLAITMVYGTWTAFWIAYTATVIGSIVAFAIGKLFGRKAVAWCIGEEDTEKYSTLLQKKGQVPFVLMQLLPFFPDDVLCMVAGLSTMSYKTFIYTMLFVKPVYIAIVCFLGTGDLIPFSGWGILAWGVIFVLCFLGCFLYFKNQDKVDAFVLSKFKKK